MFCLLCGHTGQTIFSNEVIPIYYRCERCELIFMNPGSRLSADAEFARYKTHNNDIADHRYQNFVRPLYDLITKHLPPDSIGLDFGCGNGPVLSYLLSKAGYQTKLYDPFFKPEKELLNQSYDYIFCVEVVEHFYHPAEEFKLLRTILRPKGQLFVMTAFMGPEIDFPNWYYRRDPTHVCFYTEASFEWIKHEFGFRYYQAINNQIAHLVL